MGVSVGFGVSVSVAVGVGVSEGVNVGVRLGVNVELGVKVGVMVKVAVRVGVGVNVTPGRMSMGMVRSSKSRRIHPPSNSSNVGSSWFSDTNSQISSPFVICAENPGQTVIGFPESSRRFNTSAE